MSQLFYQTIQVPQRAPAFAGTSPRGDAMGAGVKLLHRASKALNGWAVSWRVNQELDARKDDILRAIRNVEERLGQSRPGVGALVVVGIQEWEHPDPTGSRAQTFLSMHIGGAGLDYRTTLNEYLNRPQLVPGAPRGWRRKDVYLWVTRS